MQNETQTQEEIVVSLDALEEMIDAHESVDELVAFESASVAFLNDGAVIAIESYGGRITVRQYSCRYDYVKRERAKLYHVKDYREALEKVTQIL